VIVEKVIWPGLVSVKAVPILDRFAEGFGAKGRVRIGIIESRMQAVVTNISAGMGRICQEGFADHIAIRVSIQNLADILKGRDHFGLGDIINVIVTFEGTAMKPRQPGVIAQVSVLVPAVENVQPEAIHTLIQPIAEDVQHGSAHIGIAPVQVGLLLSKHVKIILTQLLIELPARSTKHGFPVIWHTATRGRIPPDIPVMVRIAAGHARLLEPAVLVRGMIEHQVEDDMDVTLMRLSEQPVEVLQITKFRVDRVVIRNVISKVSIRGGVNR